jgi:Beta-eliminating lyase
MALEAEHRKKREVERSAVGCQATGGLRALVGWQRRSCCRCAGNGEIEQRAAARRLWLLCGARDRSPDQHHAEPKLVCIENTHNRCGGAVLSLEYLTTLHAWAARLVSMMALMGCWDGPLLQDADGWKALVRGRRRGVRAGMRDG